MTRERIPAVTTGQIYQGAVAFIVLQLIIVSAVIAFPGLVSGNIDKGPQLDADQVRQQLEQGLDQPQAPAGDPLAPTPQDGGPAKDEDPMAIFRDQAPAPAAPGK